MAMEMDYTNQVVLITGGSAGIGFACAALFLELGAAVSICGTNAEKLHDALRALEGTGGSVYGEVCDVADGEALRAFAAHTRERLGEIDVWISNAGVCHRYDILDTPEAVFDHSFDVNVKAVYLGAQIAYEAMKDRGGVILIASSFAALMPSVGSGIYAATKAAVSSMVKTLAAELAPCGIRVNGYIPGVIETDMGRQTAAVDTDAMRGAIAMQRFGESREIAYAAAFLASAYAGYITGATLEISGGKLGVQNPKKAWADQAQRGSTN
ncbi:SDR family oxidoreductase [uncultured Oscillibacter sp.]|uniref:SDR family NAD(P)-dependent oxidoreductase n=1 Tax=uncultured Oscillibacter sp. TaxID=876091 RepID=UPI0028056F9A|nr:SDR family oxidoreductase [uncultured Oscillibacter sp.]